MQIFSKTNCSFPGLQQQGIFRVPGSQVEVNDIKNSFERGALARPPPARAPGDSGGTLGGVGAPGLM